MSRISPSAEDSLDGIRQSIELLTEQLSYINSTLENLVNLMSGQGRP